MSFPLRITSLILALAVAGCSSRFTPSTSGSTGSPGSGGSGASGGSGSGGTGGTGDASPCASGQSIAAAYVYASAQVSQGKNQIVAFAADANGSLTPVPGSPFPTSGPYPLSTAGAGCQLFGASGAGIDSLHVNGDGSLTAEGSLVYPANSPVQPVLLFLDRGGANLYSFDYNAPDGLRSEFGSYVFSTTGQLTQAGPEVVAGDGTLAFASNDQYAVGTYCSLRGGTVLSEYQRGSNGALSFLNNVSYPAGLPGEMWCPGGVAADSANHILIEVTPWNPESPQVDPDTFPRLAIYTVDNAGKLTTASTSQSMVNSQIGQASYHFSPDDRYLIANSPVGLQLFGWDSKDATLTTLATVSSGDCPAGSVGPGCTGPGFVSVAWDQNDHVYVILGQQLLVYNVGPSGLTPAPGSPYPVPNAWSVTVLPQTASVAAPAHTAR